MSSLVMFEKGEDVAIPPIGFANVFYSDEGGKIVKKAKLSNGQIKKILEEQEEQEEV